VKEKFSELEKRISELENQIKLLQKPNTQIEVKVPKRVKKEKSDSSNETSLETQSKTGEENKSEHMPVSVDNQPSEESKDTLKESKERGVSENPIDISDDTSLSDTKEENKK